MKIEYSCDIAKGDLKLKLSGLDKDNVSENKEKVLTIIQKVTNDLLDFYNYTSIAPVTSVVSLDKKKEDKTEIAMRPVVRDRIPNVIDLSELEIKQAVAEHPMIRCPHCGQATNVIVELGYSDGCYYLHKKDNEYKIVLAFDDCFEIEDLYKPTDASIIDYNDDIENIEVDKDLEDKDINVNMETILHCPICRFEEPFKEWVEAFKDPLQYGFETECLCDLCGGEAVSKIDKDKNEVISCECCGFTKCV